MSKLEWRGYPVAQRLGDETVEYRGHHLEIIPYFRWIYKRWHPEWDAFVDGDCVASGCDTKGEAQRACLEHAVII